MMMMMMLLWPSLLRKSRSANNKTDNRQPKAKWIVLYATMFPFFKFSKALFIYRLLPDKLLIYLPTHLFDVLISSYVLQRLLQSRFYLIEITLSHKSQKQNKNANTRVHSFSECPFNEIGPHSTRFIDSQYRLCIMYIEHEHTYDVSDLLIVDKCHQFRWNDVAIGVAIAIYAENQSWHKPDAQTHTQRMWHFCVCVEP